MRMFFFIIGINSKTEDIGTAPNVDCPSCARLTSMKITVIYQVFHFFFIPLFKWGRRYQATAYCCDAVFELDNEEGRAFERGEKDTIDGSFLHPLTSSYGGYGGFGSPNLCPHCGAELPPDARFCHRCGNKV